MPYLDEKHKMAAQEAGPFTPGQLNYLVTSLCLEYIENLSTTDRIGYQAYNDIIGALECAKQEFYRRMVVPYEDVRASENGDVFIE